MKRFLFIAGFIAKNTISFSQIIGKYKSNFSSYGLSSESLIVDCDSSFTMVKSTELFKSYKKGIWKTKEDTLILAYSDSLAHVEKYIIIDSLLKKVMPVFNQEIRDCYLKEFGEDLPKKDIRQYNMYGDKKEYFLIK